MALIVGHKGACGYATENTISSFKKAIELGCNRTEMDIRLSKEGEAIVFHNKDISMLTDGVGLISEMNLSDLKKFNYIDGQKICTLQEVIDVCKNKIDLQIELKSEGSPKVVNNLILDNKIENQIVITSFKAHLLKEIKLINPGLKVGLLFWTDETMAEIWNLIESIPLDFVAPYSEIITVDFVKKVHDMGKIVYAYGVNTKELGETLIQMGIDEIGTDYPKLFLK